MAKRKRECVCCGRKEGSTKDRGGDEDGVPLGPVQKCEDCGCWACPDCMHELDCCFADEPDVSEAWAPKGWRVSKIVYARMVKA